MARAAFSRATCTGISKYTSSPQVSAEDVTGSAARIAFAVGVSRSSASSVTVANSKRMCGIAYPVVWLIDCVKPSQRSPDGAKFNPATPWTLRALFPRLLEIAQIRRRLILAGWHQQPVGAQEIGFIPDLRPQIAFVAYEFVPIGPRVGVANVAAGHRPRARQGVIVNGDLVAHDAPVALVEIDALLEDRLIVMMQRQAGGIIMTGAFEAAGFDLQHVIAAVIVLIDPLADRIANQRRLDFFRPLAAVGVDAAGVFDPIDQHIGGFWRDDELNGLEAVCDERHPEAEAGCAAPIEEATLFLRFEVGFEDCLVFGRQGRLLPLAPWLGRVEGGLPAESTNAEDASPLPLPVGVFDLFARRGGADDHRKRHCKRRNLQRQGADRASTKHRCPPLCERRLFAA